MPGGAVVETLERVVAGTETALSSVTTPMTYTAGAVVRVQLQVTGTAPTTLRSMIWPQGSTQPTTWQVTTTDSTAALQVSGAMGLLVYLSGSATNAPETASFSTYSATNTSAATVALPTYAAIANATLPNQVVIDSPLSLLSAAVEEAKLPAPAILVIGEAVGRASRRKPDVFAGNHVGLTPRRSPVEEGAIA